MTTISAKIVADSISDDAPRLTSIQLRYPLIIHAENKTHRILVEQPNYIAEYGVPEGLMYDPALSRNARSSRAVPTEKMIQEVMDDPFIPLHWGAAQKGMQAYEENDELVVVPRAGPISRENAWLLARDNAVDVARAYLEAGYAKQLINRLLIPWLHIDTLVTATEWSNFLALRDHHAAEPHIQVLAQKIREAMDGSTPKHLREGQWHLPYVPDDAKDIWNYGLDNNLDLLDVAKKVSVARCARISYTPFDGNGSIEKEIERHDMLVSSAPMHASPAEHQATPDFMCGREWNHDHLHGNLRGWCQYRKTLAGECQ